MFVVDGKFCVVVEGTFVVVVCGDDAFVILAAVVGAVVVVDVLGVGSVVSEDVVDGCTVSAHAQCDCGQSPPREHTLLHQSSIPLTA